MLYIRQVTSFESSSTIIAPMNTTSKVLLCCGIALYIYAVRFVLKRKDSANQGEEVDSLPSLEVDSSTEPLRLLVATRIHMNSASALPDILKVVSFVRSVSSFADGILICLGAIEHTVETVEKLDSYTRSVRSLLQSSGIDSSKITFMPVSPWGYFTPALNRAIQFAQDHHFNRIAFQVQ